RCSFMNHQSRIEEMGPFDMRLATFILGFHISQSFTNRLWRSVLHADLIFIFCSLYGEKGMLTARNVLTDQVANPLTGVIRISKNNDAATLLRQTNHLENVPINR